MTTDPRWMPIEVAHKRLMERTGNADLAALDLTNALAQGRLRCLARSINTGESKPVDPTMWSQIELLSGVNVRVVWRDNPEFPHIVKPFRGVVFYVWGPDVDELLAGKAPEESRSRKTRAKKARAKESSGGRPPIPPEVIERAREMYRQMVRADERWATASAESILDHLRKNGRVKIGKTVLTDRVIKPVRVEIISGNSSR